jgi:hypothetical protein
VLFYTIDYWSASYDFILTQIWFCLIIFLQIQPRKYAIAAVASQAATAMIVTTAPLQSLYRSLLHGPATVAAACDLF